MKCCNKEFSSRKELAMHLFHNHKDHSQIEKERLLVDILYGQEIVNEYIQKYLDEEVCANDLVSVYKIDIVKLLSLMGIKRSNSEEKKTLRYKNKIESTMLERYGVTNASHLDWVQEKKIKTIESRGILYEEYLQQQRIHMRNGLNEYFQDPIRVNESEERKKETFQEKYAVDNASQIPQVRKTVSEKARSRYDKMSYQEKLEMTSKARAAVCSRGGYSSKPEKRIQKCLVDLEIDFISNKHINNYNFDMIFGKFIIEVQGDMWHAHPSKYKETDLIMGKLLVKDIWEKDKKKRQSVEKDGYTLIEIWEHEIAARKNEKELLNFVIERLEQNGFYG